MCFAAIHWARIKRVYFGTTVRDVQRLGFNELIISNRTLKRLGGSVVQPIPGILRDECRELLVDWKKLPGHRTY
jgi:guanine deaminase